MPDYYDYYYGYYYGSYEDYDEPSVKDKIRDAFSDSWETAVEKYGDETAISEWWEGTLDAAEEMATRHDDESAAFLEQVA